MEVCKPEDRKEKGQRWLEGDEGEVERSVSQWFFYLNGHSGHPGLVLKALEGQSGWIVRKRSNSHISKSNLPWPVLLLEVSSSCCMGRKRERRQDWMQASTLELLSSSR